MGSQLEAARLHAALAKDDPLDAFKPPADASRPMIEMQRRLLASQVAAQKAKLASTDGQIAQKEAERATIKASIDKLKATIQPLQERVDIRRIMFSKELGSKLIYLQELQDLVGQQKEVLVQESRLSESDSAIAALQETRSKTVAEYEHGLLDDLAKADQKAAGLAQDVIKAEQRTSLQKLTAPLDGVVQQLAVHTIGGVGTPAQQLMVIVPGESRLEIDAMISNRNVGFVEVGQEAAIKVDTFNFTRYGLLHGTVLTVSNDAIQRDRPQDKQPDKPQAAEAGSSEPKGQELVYAARVSLDHARMQVEDKTPGDKIPSQGLASASAVTADLSEGPEGTKPDGPEKDPMPLWLRRWIDQGLPRTAEPYVRRPNAHFVPSVLRRPENADLLRRAGVVTPPVTPAPAPPVASVRPAVPVAPVAGSLCPTCLCRVPARRSAAERQRAYRERKREQDVAP